MNNKNLKLLFFKKDNPNENKIDNTKEITVVIKDNVPNKNTKPIIPINKPIVPISKPILPINKPTLPTNIPTMPTNIYSLDENLNNTMLINNLLKVKSKPPVENKVVDVIEENEENKEKTKEVIFDDETKNNIETVKDEAVKEETKEVIVKEETKEPIKEISSEQNKSEELINNMLKTIDENYELEKKNKLEELEKIKNDFLINSENNKNILKSYIKSKLQNCIIPLVIYQTWMTKLLPDKMMKSVEKLRKANPEFEYKLFDDTDCRNFIDLHFNSNVLFAYDNLVPGAFKADLWRYCVLFIYGGIYIDIKYEPVNNFKLIDLIDKNHFVLDRPGFFKGHVGIYNGFIISEPNNTIFLKLINAVVDNVKNKYYGNNPLAVTGPSLVGKTLYPTNDKCTPAIEKSFELKYSLDGTGIEYNNKKILTQYLDYRKDQIKFTKTTYHILWEKRKIFKF